MEQFVKNQILSYNNKKYDIKDFEKSKNDLFVVKIKNNKLKYTDDTNYLDRPRRIINILEMLLLEYVVTDTVLLINLHDGYNWKYDLPVFNFGVPDGKPGLIFVNFDILEFIINKNTIKNYDEIKKMCKKYEPEEIINDIYFKGGDTSIKRTQIREKLSTEKLPIHVIANKDYSEEIYMLKNHKYVLDLSGVKPQSLRFKFLILMSRVIFRISFYNPEIGETSYWKQYYDYILNDEEDYVHLKYELNYDKKIDDKLYKTIKSDILKVYNYLEENPKSYDKIVENLNKRIKKINIKSSLKYLHCLIESYTKNLLL